MHIEVEDAGGVDFLATAKMVVMEESLFPNFQDPLDLLPIELYVKSLVCIFELHERGDNMGKTLGLGACRSHAIDDFTNFRIF